MFWVKVRLENVTFVRILVALKAYSEWFCDTDVLWYNYHNKKAALVELTSLLWLLWHFMDRMINSLIKNNHYLMRIIMKCCAGILNCTCVNRSTYKHVVWSESSMWSRQLHHPEPCYRQQQSTWRPEHADPSTGSNMRLWWNCVSVCMQESSVTSWKDFYFNTKLTETLPLPHALSQSGCFSCTLF